MQPNTTKLTLEKRYFILLKKNLMNEIKFIWFDTATELMDFYGDASVSEGEEGRSYSKFVLCLSHSWEYLTAEAEAEARDKERQENDYLLYNS